MTGRSVQRCSRLSRRVFIRSLARVAPSAAVLPWLACELEGGAPEDRTDGARPEPPAAVCPPFMTPIADFFRQFGGSRTVQDWQMPMLDAQTVLRIEGLVAAPLELDLSLLEADEEQHRTVLKTMLCVLGWRSSALFTGVPLRVLLDRAGIDRAATRRVRFFGADAFENNLRLEDIYASASDMFEPLVVFWINGERLPQALGFPFRLLLNDRFGFKNIKWLTRIVASAEDRETGQYQSAGYPDAGIIEPTSTVENLRVHEMVPAGPVEVCGFALSGRGGIERVELALDGAELAPAALTNLQELQAAYPEITRSEQLVAPDRFGFPPLGVWAQWRAVLELEPGVHRLAVRVLDRAGNAADGTTLTLDARS